MRFALSRASGAILVTIGRIPRTAGLLLGLALQAVLIFYLSGIEPATPALATVVYVIQLAHAVVHEYTKSILTVALVVLLTMAGYYGLSPVAAEPSLAMSSKMVRGLVLRNGAPLEEHVSLWRSDTAERLTAKPHFILSADRDFMLFVGRENVPFLIPAASVRGLTHICPDVIRLSVMCP